MTALTVHPIRRIARFMRDRRAVSSIEFAIILPLMLVLYLGSAEVTPSSARSP